MRRSMWLLPLAVAGLGGACAGFDAAPSADGPDAGDTEASAPEGAAGRPCSACRSGWCDDSGKCEPLVFITVETYSGSLGGGGDGGIARGDALCQAAAGSPGTFRAWLSDSTEGALSHVTKNGTAARRLRLSDGTVVATSMSDLLGDAGGPTTAIHSGPTSGIVSDGDLVWTGTERNGALAGNSCGGWKNGSMALNAVVGEVGAGRGWSRADGNRYLTHCASKAHLYCFEVVP